MIFCYYSWAKEPVRVIIWFEVSVLLGSGDMLVHSDYCIVYGNYL